MPITVLRLGSPRKPDEGLRLGTVRRPPRGEAQAAKDERSWRDFERRFRKETSAPDAARLLAERGAAFSGDASRGEG